MTSAERLFGPGLSWDVIVRRHDRIVRNIARSRGLTGPDVEDVAQTTWLKLLEYGSLRDPPALPGWLATTAKRETFRVRDRRSREMPLPECDAWPAARSFHAVDSSRARDENDPLSDVLRAERRGMLRRSVASLPSRGGDLLTLMFSDAEPSYRDIASTLDIPIGSIGPTRQRLLKRLRDDPALRAVPLATARPRHGVPQA